MPDDEAIRFEGDKLLRRMLVVAVLAFADIDEAKAWFEGRGCRVLGEPRIGAHGTPIFFVHPKDMGGVLTEFMETPKSGH